MNKGTTKRTDKARTSNFFRKIGIATGLRTTDGSRIRQRRVKERNSNQTR